MRSRQKWKKHVFIVHFHMFFSDFWFEISDKGLKLTKKVENGWKKELNQLLGVRSTQKLVEIHNRLCIQFEVVKCKVNPLKYLINLLFSLVNDPLSYLHGVI